MAQRTAAIVLTASFTVAACSDDQESTSTSAAAVATTDEAPPASVATEPPVPSAGPAIAGDDLVLTAATQAALDAVPGWLSDPTSVPAEVFEPAFLAEVPIDDVQAGLASLGGGIWTTTRVVPLTETAVVATIQGPDRALDLQLETNADGLISTLFFENAALAEPPADLEELMVRLETSGERTAFVLADVGADGTCTAIDGLRPDDLLPVASTFKLYVLAALADAVSAGTVAWDQPVTIQDALDSPIGGPTIDQPDGSALSVRELAQSMIEVSDNTATDHLIDLLGREAVERALATGGHADPAATQPVLSTREMSVLKTNPELLAEYAAADETGRRDLLAGPVATAVTPTAADVWSTPRAVFEVEWFASPMDLCRVLAALDARAAEPALAPVREILSANPGMVVDPARYEYLAFKGGSEPGVLVGAWLGRRTDGTTIVVAGGAASSTAPIDPSTIELVGSALNLR